jgi:hypothetical protein
MFLSPRSLPAGFIAPCLPTSAPLPPSGELWLHEINHDGFTLQPAGERSDLALSAYASALLLDAR